MSVGCIFLVPAMKHKPARSPQLTASRPLWDELARVAAAPP